MKKFSLIFLFGIVLLTVLKFCHPKNEEFVASSSVLDSKTLSVSVLKNIVEIDKNVRVEDYFQYLDSIVLKYDSLTSYNLSEHLLVRSNPWIIDTLQNTDYYRMMAKDSFVYNQKKMIALPIGNHLIIPDSIQAEKILDVFQKTSIIINIPEFKLRIYEDSKEIYEFPIRVGRNEEKYLKMSRRIQDLKTKTGEGFIIKHVRNPRYVNPANNHEYFVTKRDDEKVTKLPQIPFIETEINGFRYGQLIHPTTNPVSLGKAYSNGCIGTSEADAWVIYYYAPINTKINIRYDLNVYNDDGEKVVLKDIYNRNK